ncbi:MAG: CxxC-x17-CxxC domain-containing protein, partial [Bacteroidota bacterium]
MGSEWPLTQRRGVWLKLIVGRGVGFAVDSTGRRLFEADCWVCGRKVQLPFKPDGIRPVYCKDDIKKVRAGLITKPKPRLVITPTVTEPAAPADLPTIKNGDTVDAVIRIGNNFV